MLLNKHKQEMKLVKKNQSAEENWRFVKPQRHNVVFLLETAAVCVFINIKCLRENTETENQLQTFFFFFFTVNDRSNTSDLEQNTVTTSRLSSGDVRRDVSDV